MTMSSFTAADTASCVQHKNGGLHDTGVGR